MVFRVYSAVLAFLCVEIISVVNIANSYADDFDPWSQSATYEIDYIIDLTGLPSDEIVNLWVPLPSSDHNQNLVSSKISSRDSHWKKRYLQDSGGNSIVELVLPADIERSDTLQLTHIVKRKPSRGLAIDALAKKDRPEYFLSSSKKVPIDGLIANIARQQARGLENKQRLLRNYYDFVYDSMTYSKEGEGWGQGDAIWACQSKYGNCTDFHSLYIGLVRSQQIPARFKIGFPLSPSEASGRHDGYHCWAEVYDESIGWLPLDASEAKKAGQRDRYFGHIPSDRVEFSQGRDLVLSDLQRGDPINYFIYPYAETATQIVDRLPIKLLYRRIATGTSDKLALQ